MPAIEKTIFINAPLKKVFAFMAEPHSLIEIWPSLQEIDNLQPLPNGGYCFDWTYKMAGLRLHGRVEWLEFIKDRRIVYRNEAGIPGTLIWTYQAENGGTRVSVAVDYTVPGVVLARLTEPVIQKMNEHESEAILANLKALMEG